jgi:excisionase family DNA binding protein
MLSERNQSVTVGRAAAIVGLSKPLLYAAIKEGSLKAWRPWARGDLRINLDELERWAGRSATSTSAA